MRAALLLLCCMLTAACDEHRDAARRRANELTQVSVTSDLQGRALHGEAHIEMFGCDGAWYSWEQPQRYRGQSYGPDVELRGTYSLNDGQLCVTPEGGEQSCRTITLVSGQILADGGPEAEGAAKPYSVVRLGGEEFCGVPQMRTAEIRALYAGASIVADPNIVVHDAETRRTFACDGTWYTLGGQVQINGTYTVSDDQICQTTATTTVCKTVYRDPGGRVYESYNVGPDLPATIVTERDLVRDVPSCE